MDRATIVSCILGVEIFSSPGSDYLVMGKMAFPLDLLWHFVGFGAESRYASTLMDVECFIRNEVSQ